MRERPKLGLGHAICGLMLFAVWAEAQVHPRNDTTTATPHPSARTRTLSANDRSKVVETAIQSRKLRYSEHDCSHLVHAIYENAGFTYKYASSDDLYAGADHFQRVAYPQPGDLIVWHGHVGIVIRPSRHTFFSFLSNGPATDNYRSAYWRSRGQPRFLRYVKTRECYACAVARNSR